MFGRGVLLGNTTSLFFFILVLKILFLFIKSKPEIEELIIFHHCFLYSAYADDKKFFLKNTMPIKEAVDTFHFSILFRIKTKFARLQVLDFCNGVNLAVTIIKQILKICNEYKAYPEQIYCRRLDPLLLN